MVGETHEGSLVPHTGTFVEDAEDAGRKIAMIGTDEQGNYQEMKLLHVVGFLGDCKQKFNFLILSIQFDLQVQL